MADKLYHSSDTSDNVHTIRPPRFFLRTIVTIYMEELAGLTFLFAFAVSTATSGQKKVRRAVVSEHQRRQGRRDRDQTEGDG
jgi:hypothetical protein